jgi:hypothetical protein
MLAWNYFIDGLYFELIVIFSNAWIMGWNSIEAEAPSILEPRD